MKLHIVLLVDANEGYAVRANTFNAAREKMRHFRRKALKNRYVKVLAHARTVTDDQILQWGIFQNQNKIFEIESVVAANLIYGYSNKQSWTV